MSLTKWDVRYIGLAKYIAQWSKDNSTRVGAVLVDEDQRVISLGFNGPPRGVSDEYESRDQKIHRTIHAEMNAVLFAARSLKGATVYVTHAPCANCAAMLVQKGVARVVFETPSEDFLSRWAASYGESLKMFAEAGVVIVEFKEM